jgi:S-adenosylmethionine:tRNA ribosyltransferase-isomerase
MFDIQDYAYDLPESLIAQVPSSRRDHARLLVVARSGGTFLDRHFYDLPNLLNRGDLLVVNNTEVIPARLFGRKESGGRIEVLVLEHADSHSKKSDTRWCLSKSAKRSKKGNRLNFGQGVSGTVEDVRDDGLTLIRFNRPSSKDPMPVDEGPSLSENPVPSEGAGRFPENPLSEGKGRSHFSIDQFLQEKGHPFHENPMPDGKGRSHFSIDQFLQEKGTMPLPPYIKRDGSNGRSLLDRERYQTLFCKKKGAVAAPTAGLHFTKTLIEKLNRTGVSLVELTLHVGHGTFKPVRTRDIRKHELGEENYIIDPATAETINRFKKEGKRIIAVGTTVVRALESAAQQNGEISCGEGKTELLITPGYRFKVIDGIITNFHLPRSSLLFLVSAFAGLKVTREAYQRAVLKKYRFYSYGDAMMIL